MRRGLQVGCGDVSVEQELELPAEPAEPFNQIEETVCENRCRPNHRRLVVGQHATASTGLEAVLSG
jgi:hypothetical protein